MTALRLTPCSRCSLNHPHWLTCDGRVLPEMCLTCQGEGRVPTHQDADGQWNGDRTCPDCHDQDGLPDLAASAILAATDKWWAMTHPDRQAHPTDRLLVWLDHTLEDDTMSTHGTETADTDSRYLGDALGMLLVVTTGSAALLLIVVTVVRAVWG